MVVQTRAQKAGLVTAVTIESGLTTIRAGRIANTQKHDRFEYTNYDSIDSNDQVSSRQDGSDLGHIRILKLENSCVHIFPFL